MTSKNDITGDLIKTKESNSAYSEGWDRIFGKKQKIESHEIHEKPKFRPNKINNLDDCYED